MQLRTVIEIQPEWSYRTFQELYVAAPDVGLKPLLVFLHKNGEGSTSLYFQTNAQGFKGDDRDPTRRLAVVWGDSVVFGIGRGWVPLLETRFPGWQFFNGGIEGNRFTQIFHRMQRANREMVIDLNIVLPGWHPSKPPSNDGLREALFEVVRTCPNTVLCTMPTSLNARVVAEDMSDCFVEESGPCHYAFMGTYEYSVETAQRLYAHILERNETVRAIGRAAGVPIVDLFEAMRSDELDDYREYFFDVCHPRIEKYDEFSGFLAEELKKLGDIL